VAFPLLPPLQSSKNEGIAMAARFKRFKEWIVPPIVLPIALILAIVAYGALRAPL
jgi:hypothetical protein